MHVEDLPPELKAVVKTIDGLPRDLRSKLSIRQLASQIGIIVSVRDAAD